MPTTANNHNSNRLAPVSILAATILLASTSAYSLKSPETKTMVYDIFGGEGINIEIPKEVFPTKEELDKMEALAPGGQHGWFESCYQNKKLHYVSWLPKGKVKGVVVWCHGVNTQCWRGLVQGDRKLSISLVVDAFLKKGIAVYAFDFLGHGFSEGTRFYIPSWETNMNDIVTFCNLAASKHDEKLPFFLTGESYGACLVLHVAKYFQENPEKGPSSFDSILMTAPAIIGDLPPFPVYQILRYLLAPAFPKWIPFFMPHPVSADRVWRDKEVLKDRTDERYLEMGIDGAGQLMRLGTALSLVIALDACRAKVIPGLKVPFCSLHGTDDYGVKIEGSQYLFDTADTPADQKEFHSIQGAYHDLFADPLAEDCIELWMKFIDKRMKA